MQIDSDAAKPPNPFNPGSPVDPSDFVGRAQELENFRQRLEQTANGSLASMAVAGGYGVGKTSFLHKCKNIAESEGALAIYFSLNELPHICKETLAKMLINRIKVKVHEEVVLERISSRVFETLQRIRLFTDSGVGMGVGPAAQEQYPNLQSALSAAWKALGDSKKAMVFLIDEAGVLEKNRAELMLYLRAVKDQLQIKKTPVMFVPAGKLSITGPSGTGFSPLVRTFPPAIMAEFSREECRLFIEKKLAQAGVSAGEGVFDYAYGKSAGHPYVLTAYMNCAYSKLGEGEHALSMVHLRATDIDFVQVALAPFFSRFYDDAGRVSRNILSLMAQSAGGEASLSGLCASMGHSNNQLSPYLARLVQDGAIIRIDRGVYQLFHPLFREYILSKESPDCRQEAGRGE